MVKYVKYVHFLSRLWSLDAKKRKWRAFCCLTQWSKGLYKCTVASVTVLLLFCSPHDYIPVLFDL